MNADKRRLELDGISQRVIGCAYDVANTLGAGFLEKVYENALTHEIRKAGLQVKQQHCVQVKYDGVIVGDFAADLLVQDCVLVELKACKTFDDIHAAQCMNYLRATGLSVCLLINFGSPKVQIKRIVHRY
ncbi:MAG: GxxExxY protein [Candidatus Acidiferrales bacterium]